MDIESVFSQVTSVRGAAGRGRRKTSKLKGQSEALGENADRLQEPATGVEGFRTVRRTSQAASLFFKSLQKRRRRRRVAVKSVAAEGGAPSGEGVATSSEVQVPDTGPRKPRRRRGRRALFGRQPKTHKRDAANNHPKGHPRTKRVYYTYIAAPSQMVDASRQAQMVDRAPAATEFEELSSASPAATPSGRASRVIKVPKRFLDEEIAPKGSPSTRLKSQVKEEDKSGPSAYELDRSENTPKSDCLSDGDPAVKRLAAGTSHTEIYKNLKRLTLKLAEQKRWQPDAQSSPPGDGNGLTAAHTKRRRRSTLTMEELDAPGVVRKLAVLVNASANPPAPGVETEMKSKTRFFISFVLMC